MGCRQWATDLELPRPAPRLDEHQKGARAPARVQPGRHQARGRLRGEEWKLHTDLAGSARAARAVDIGEEPGSRESYRIRDSDRGWRGGRIRSARTSPLAHAAVDGASP